jgi:hypothetical protein
VFELSIKIGNIPSNVTKEAPAPRATKSAGRAQQTIVVEEANSAK